MANSNDLKHEFIEYTRNCILSRRPSNKSDFLIGQTAAVSYVSFVEVDKLFSYNPEKWKDIKSIFDIDSSERIKEIYLDLIGDSEFNIVDTQLSSQYYRSNAIKHYYCFLKAREIILGKTAICCSPTDNSFKSTQNTNECKHQQIIYGAPGTGKSHAVKTETEAWEKKGRVERTTFHPDSDYATFVGAYKPTTDSVQRYDITNQPIIRNGVPVMEQIITYNFVEQAFIKAYIEAWKDREKPEFLVIEEINRGNCAQIFGDLFQLLDRGDNGYSEYAIRADTDLQKHLCKAFEDVEIEDYPKIKSGTELLLPNNLYIRATMNTSDQSLFPIDSAFKRRWDWKYVPIAKGNDNGTELNWKIEIDGNQYDWWTFVKTINKHVFDTTNSEDKQLGFFFCKAKNNIISAETFVFKVIFYLWNDVFKDFGFEDKIFEDKEDSVNPKLSFDKFYMANGAVNGKKIKMFLKNLGIMPIENEDDPEDEDGNKINSDSIGRDYTKYSINGIGQYAKNNLAAECVKKYIELNPLKTADEVLNDWLSLGNIVPHFIESKEQYDARTDNSKRSHEIQCGDTVLYVAHTGYGSNGKADILKEAVNNKGWGISIDKV